MPITREQATALAELVCTVRPQWNARGVLTKGLAPLAKHPAPLAVIAWAAIRAAENPENRTPAVIPLNGPHWNLADRPPEPRLTPDLECRQHPGKWAGNCPLCRVDHLDGHDDPVLTNEDHDHRDPKTRARDAARKAKEQLGGPTCEWDGCDATAAGIGTVDGDEYWLCLEHKTPQQPDRIAERLATIDPDTPEDPPEPPCPQCGHHHTPNGCTGDPTASDKWAGVTPAACDCPNQQPDRITQKLAELDPATIDARHPERRGMSPDERRRAAARDCRPNPVDTATERNTR